MQFDVFNGDADGLCALHQLRLHEPRAATLITGPKRDIALLQRVPARSGNHVTVLDISLDVNRAPLLALLTAGVSVEYFDHHVATDIPAHPLLRAVIDEAPEICTSALVDRHIGGKHRLWAIVGAFGDDLAALAAQLAASCGLTADRLDTLHELGDCLNYNAYANEADDGFVDPAALYETMRPHADPFAFLAAAPGLRAMRDLRDRDLALACALEPAHASPAGYVYVLPVAPWSRRVRGILGSHMAAASPTLAIAVLAPDEKGGYAVSVRAPRSRMHGADALCGEFPTGGGRAAAAGINHLPSESLPRFIRRFEAAFGAPDAAKA